MKLEISKKEIEVLNAFLSGNDNPDLFGADATIFVNKKSLIKYIEPLRQKLLKLRKEN
jgi:hypothetical protein